MSIAAARRNRSHARCGGDAFAAPKFSLPGLAFAWAISSCAVFTGTSGPTTSTNGAFDTKATGAKLFIASYPGRLEQRGTDRERPDRTQQQRVAIRRRARRGLRSDDAAGARAVLDDDRPHPRGQLLADQPRDRVRLASRIERHDELDHVAGIGLSRRAVASSGRYPPLPPTSETVESAWDRSALCSFTRPWVSLHSDSGAASSQILALIGIIR